MTSPAAGSQRRVRALAPTGPGGSRPQGAGSPGRPATAKDPPGGAEVLLRRAAAVVGARHRSYGAPRALFEGVAARWSLTLGVPITPAEVVLCLLDLKLARLAHDPKHLDSLVDLAGYAAVLHEVGGDDG